MVKFSIAVAKNFKELLRSSRAYVNKTWEDLASFYCDPVQATVSPTQGDMAIEGTELHEITNNVPGRDSNFNAAREEHDTQRLLRTEVQGSSSGVAATNEAWVSGDGVGRRSSTWPWGRHL
jgi:hypothetical protein